MDITLTFTHLLIGTIVLFVILGILRMIFDDSNNGYLGFGTGLFGCLGIIIVGVFVVCIELLIWYIIN